MPYRADVDALQARCESLARELDAVRTRVRELESSARDAAVVERELAEARARLRDASGGSAASLLESVRIATPCRADWNEMTGDDRVRFCGKCEKHVFNLSAMTREEAERLLREKTGAMCARLYRRADGTVLTADCPVGVRAKRVRRLAVVAVGGSVAAAIAGTGFAFASQGKVAAPCPIGSAQPETGQMIMGDIAPAASAEPKP